MVSSSGQTKVHSYFKPKAKRGRRFKVGSKSGRKTKGKDAETVDEQQLRKEAVEFDSKLPDKRPATRMSFAKDKYAWNLYDECIRKWFKKSDNVRQRYEEKESHDLPM